MGWELVDATSGLASHETDVFAVGKFSQMRSGAADSGPLKFLGDTERSLLPAPLIERTARMTLWR